MKINSQNLLAVSVLLVSVTAVIVAYMQASIMKEQQRIMHQDFEASLWPYIEISYNYNPAEAFEILVTNKGVGPAIIDGITVEHGDSTVNNWQEIEELIRVDTIPRYGISNSSIDGTVISADEERKWFAVYEGTTGQQLYEFFINSTFKVCYRSVHGTQWAHVRSQKGGRLVSNNTEIESCEIDEKDAFQDIYEVNR